MAWNSSTSKWWEYLIPGWGQILQTRDLFQGDPGASISKVVGGVKELTQKNSNTTDELADEASTIADEARDEYLEDRDHTEMREDTAYQRAVADMRAAGLNPYTVGASPASSTASTVGENSIANKLQMLGYILDLENLNAKNRGITNNTITGILRILK